MALTHLGLLLKVECIDLLQFSLLETHISTPNQDRCLPQSRTRRKKKVALLACKET